MIRLLIERSTAPSAEPARSSTKISHATMLTELADGTACRWSGEITDFVTFRGTWWIRVAGDWVPVPTASGGTER